MKRNLLTLFVLFVGIHTALCQTIDCGTAVQQLQNYIAQVNNIYQQEYWQVIPNQRCPAVNQFGQPFHPQLVQNCRNQWLMSLNQWYNQQAYFVNNTNSQIVQSCVTREREISQPARRVGQTTKEAPEMDSDLEELTAGIDEEKTVRIKIPTTAAGFRNR